MVSTGNLLAFAVTAFVLTGVPGPSVLFVVGRALTIGRSGALTTVKLTGAAYLVYLGVQAIRHRHDEARAAPGAAPADGRRRTAAKPYRRVVREGFLVGMTNPKSLGAQMALSGRP